MSELFVVILTINKRTNSKSPNLVSVIRHNVHFYTEMKVTSDRYRKAVILLSWGLIYKVLERRTTYIVHRDKPGVHYQNFLVVFILHVWTIFVKLLQLILSVFLSNKKIKKNDNDISKQIFSVFFSFVYFDI